MSRSKLVLTTLAVVMLVFVGAFPGEQAAGAASEPCAPDLEVSAGGGDIDDTDDVQGPAPPKNLRLIGGVLGSWLEMFQVKALAAGQHAYFDMLTNRQDCMSSFHYRTQANIDLVRSRATTDRKIPIVYDSKHDAAKFEIDPSGSLPHSGGTGTPQKRIPLGVQGKTSLLITWDLKIAESMRYLGPDYLTQHKSHRLDDRGAGGWIGMKQRYSEAATRGLGIAKFFFTTAQKYMGPGTVRGPSETIMPVNGEYYIQPDTWTRVWLFFEGNIGLGDNLVQMSVWLADENRAPHQLYDRVNMIAPSDGIGIFRFEFDSSTKESANGPGQQWQRNWVALRGIPRGDVLKMLQQPMK